MNRAGFLIAVLVLGLHAASGAGIKVDINPDNNRKDVLTPGWQDWRVKDGVPSATAEFDGVKATLRPAAGSGKGLGVGWWKGGLDYGVTMANDGVYVAGGPLELVLS